MMPSIFYRVLKPATMLAFAFTISACTSNKNAQDKLVVIKVDQTAFTAKDFADELLLKLRDHNALSAKNPKQLNRAKEDIINDFILTVLVRKYAKENGLFVSTEEFDKRLGQILSSYPSELEFQKTLAERGIDFKSWKKKLRDTMLHQEVVLHIYKTVPDPTKEQLNDFYKKNRQDYKEPAAIQLSQIVLESESDANEIQIALKKGRSFEEIAKQYSITPEGKEGGKLGWIEQGIAPVFDEAFSLGVGQRSKVYSSDFGFHIFKVSDRRRLRYRKFDEAKSEIRHQLRRTSEKRAFTSWMEKQLRQAKVSVDRDAIAKIEVETRGVQ